MTHEGFYLAGSEVSWPIGTAAGMTNHPDIRVVKKRFEDLVGLGVGEVVLGSWVLGAARGGNAYTQLPSGSWDYAGGDEYADVPASIGHNAKGLPGPGTDTGLDHLADFVEIGKARDTRVSLSLSPHSQEPLKEIPDLLEVARRALLGGVLRVEFNLSCPNIPDRPPFYLDFESMNRFIEIVRPWSHRLQNTHMHAGLYPKFGPMGNTPSEIALRNSMLGAVREKIFGGIVTSNTVLGMGKMKTDGSPVVTVNGGKAGQSGPYFKDVGMTQLSKWVGQSNPNQKSEIVSVLGIDSGKEVSRRLAFGATFCQLGSAIYWPELVQAEQPKNMISTIKEDLLSSSHS